MSNRDYDYERFSAMVERFVRDRKAAGLDKNDLPQGWEEMSLPRLWEQLNDERRIKRVAESTFQAVVYVLRTYGMKRLDDPWLTNRLANFTDAKIKELVTALRRMQPNYPAITDQLIAEIEKLEGQEP